MKLVEDWKIAWKWLSVQFSFLLITVATAYEFFPQYINPYLPAPWSNRVMLVLGVLVIIGRLKKQS